MLIINADDWGRSREETDAAAACFRQGRITSATAMVFMDDSERAAAVAAEQGIPLGLHLNFAEPFTGRVDKSLRARHERIVRFLNRGKYATALYHPLLRDDFQLVFAAQHDEFVRLYGGAPTHIDGHHHFHHCANVLLADVIPKGTRLRRSFHFWPGEKGALNRGYRNGVDWLLRRRYRLADYFFALPYCLDEIRMSRVLSTARRAVVEVMAHPVHATEREFLTGARFATTFGTLELGTYEAV